MERVLKSVPVDLRGKMEALVHDLSIALEESNNSANVRRRWGIRRRARSTGNIPALIRSKQSDDSSSSVCEAKNVQVPSLNSKYQSDSDDTNQTKRFANFSNFNIISNIESDSVNENFVPRVTRRKRKFKRMAIDPDAHPSTSQALSTLSSTVGKKKKVFRNDWENRYGAIWCGKRKRSCRERSTDCEMRSRLSRASKLKGKEKGQNDDAMDCSRLSSSSISSSDSEEGLITNDEDREGDDEQSDWVGESSWWDDCESTSEEKSSINPTIQLMMHFRDNVNGREILAGRRHVDNTPSYSIITSANEKVSRFLQDPNQSELKLHPIRQFEREKLRRLANLYSLHLKGDLSCPVLHKTKHTTQAVCVDQVSLNRLSDYKRLRKTPPNSPNPDSEMMNDDSVSIIDNGCGSIYHVNYLNDAQNNATNVSSTKWNPCTLTKEESISKPHSFGYSNSS